jgi:hypothetical protein
MFLAFPLDHLFSQEHPASDTTKRVHAGSDYNKAREILEFQDVSQRPLRRSIKFYAGIGFALGEYGDNDILSDNAGFAQPGIGGGIEYTMELLRGFGIAVSGMANANLQDVKPWNKTILRAYFSGDNRAAYWLMGGIFTDYYYSSEGCLYYIGEAGLLHANFPNLTIMPFGQELEATFSAPSVSTMGYLLGAGISYRRYDLSLRFLYGSPEYTPAFRNQGQLTELRPETRTVNILQLSLGLIF